VSFFCLFWVTFLIVLLAVSSRFTGGTLLAASKLSNVDKLVCNMLCHCQLLPTGHSSIHPLTNLLGGISVYKPFPKCKTVGILSAQVILMTTKDDLPQTAHL
jgi:hypothetical protein